MIEKKLVLGLMGSSFIGGCYMLLKGGNKVVLSKDKIIEKREQFLEDKQVRMLYSTMTFFYLYGYEKNEVKSLFKLYDILQIAKPQIVSLNITKDDYENDYKDVQQHPKFKEVMTKVDYYLRIKSNDIKDMKEITLENLENLYLIDYCNKNKCQLIFQNQNQEQLKSIQQVKQKVQSMIKDQKTEDCSIDELFQNQYVDNILKTLQPKYQIIPTNPYKTIVGIINSENLDGISKQWKSKFKSTYGHQVIEDENQK